MLVLVVECISPRFLKFRSHIWSFGPDHASLARTGKAIQAPNHASLIRTVSKPIRFLKPDG